MWGVSLRKQFANKSAVAMSRFYTGRVILEEPRCAVPSTAPVKSFFHRKGKDGRLAQLVRAPALQAGGRRFESCTAHHHSSAEKTSKIVSSQLFRSMSRLPSWPTNYPLCPDLEHKLHRQLSDASVYCRAGNYTECR